MKAARLFGKGDIRVVDCEKPEPGEGEALIAIKAVAICPSDVKFYKEGESGGVAPEGPHTLGHEFAGVVEECREDDPSFASGTRVAVEPSWHCGECDYDPYVCQYLFRCSSRSSALQEDLDLQQEHNLAGMWRFRRTWHNPSLYMLRRG